jgi:hypothetical protein
LGVILVKILLSTITPFLALYQTKLTIFNRSEGKWAFDGLAQTLTRSLWVDVSDIPGDLNYILCTDAELIGNPIQSFIPIESIRIAADKQQIEQRFQADNVIRPKTLILDSLAAIAVAKSALIATGLYDSFGAVDLLQDDRGKWYALEVGTDGIYSHSK